MIFALLVGAGFRGLNTLRTDNKGAGMVEFAIVAAVFSMMLLGILEFGLAAWQRNSAAADAREGARWAAVHGARSGSAATADMVQAYVRTRTSLDKLGVRVYTTWTPNKEPGSIVSVSVAHSVPRRGPFIPAHTDSATSKLVILF